MVTSIPAGFKWIIHINARRILALFSLIILPIINSLGQPAWFVGTPTVTPKIFSIDFNYGITSAGKVYISLVNYNYTTPVPTSIDIKNGATAGPSGGRISTWVIDVPDADKDKIFTINARNQIGGNIDLIPGHDYTFYFVAADPAGIPLQANPVRILTKTLPCPSIFVLTGFNNSDRCVYPPGATKVFAFGFSNNVINGATWHIDWGDGIGTYDFTSTTDNEVPPNQIYTYNSHDSCVYDVTLNVKNPGACALVGQSVKTEHAMLAGRDWDPDGNGDLKVEDVNNAGVTDTIYVCEGYQTDVQVQDISIWDCQPGSYPDPPGEANKESRTLQWVYGGQVPDGTAGANLNTITGDVIVGSLGTAVKNDTGIIGDTIVTKTIGYQSEVMTIPATAIRNEIFKVWFKNWNMCNPFAGLEYDNSNYVNTEIIIKVIASPDPPSVDDVDVCEGGTRTFTVNTGVTPPVGVISWYDVDPIIFPAAIPVATGISYTPPVIPAGTSKEYWVVDAGASNHGVTCKSQPTKTTLYIREGITNNTGGADETICTGTAPAAQNGSVPSGGAGPGTYAYLWESSPTGIAGSWGPAAGINNLEDYTPGNLTATTYYHRRVISSTCVNYSTSVKITVSSAVGTPVFTAGATTVCQDAPNTTYTATAANTTGIAYSVSPVGAGTINSSTGVMDWSSTFNGTATIRASAAGCGGPKTADRIVTVTPTVGTPVFTAGATSVCQNAPNETYTATASNSTAITYSVLPAGAGSINSSTGVMDWSSTFSGTATITASAAGCNGPKTADRNVTVNPSIPVSVSVTASENPVCPSTVVTFTAIPTNGGTAPAYQWKVNSLNVGINNSTYSYTPLNNDVVTCVLTSNITPCPTNNPATSVPVTMTVNPLLPVSVLIAASANPSCAGASVTFTATPTNGGASPSYQWKVNTLNVGSNSSTYSYVPANGDVITCVLTSSFSCATGNPATSTPITMTVNANPAALVLTGSTICVSPGGNGTITSTTSVVGVNYQLYNSANATVQAAKAGTGSGLSWTGLSSGNGYYVVSANAATCTATSTPVNVTTTANPAALVLTGSTICVSPGGNGTITSTTSVVGVNYQLYNSANATVQAAKAGTGSGLSWTGLSSGNGYYVVSANAATCTATSTPVNVTTTANPAALVLTGSTICVSPGGNGTITSTTSVVGVNYQLYNSANATVQAAKAGTGSGLSWTGLSSGNGYYVVSANAATCTATSTPVNVTTTANPAALVLTGSTICVSPGGNGTITSTTSVVGVNYQLYNSANATVQAAKAGTGSGLSWTGLSSGNGYYVVSANAATCTATSTPVNVTTTANPAALVLTGSTICVSPGGNGTITSTTSVVGVNYQLYNSANATVQAAKAGTGSGLSWTGLSSGNGYYVVSANAATCTATSTPVNVTTTANPAALVLTGSTICVSPGGNGTITSTTSVVGVNYQLYNSANATVQAAKAGTGSGLSWTGLSSGNGYYVVSANAATCTATSTPVNVTTTANPAALVLTGSTICVSPGGNGTITSTTSVVGVNYQLYNSANATVQAAKAGTGSGLSWTGLSSGNGYYVVSANAATCTATSTPVNVTTTANPAALVLTGSTICVSPGGNGTITSTTSVVGVNYQLYNSANATVQAAKAGTGSGLSWTGLSSGNGYYVVSANAATCTATSTPVNVTTTANPAALVLTGSTICVSPGGNGTITSTTSVVGVNYQLYNSANATVQAAKAGTGSGLSWTGLSSGNGYYVVSANAATCTATSTPVNVTTTANPAALVLTGSTICVSPGGNGTITSTTSVVGVNYQLYNSANATVQAAKAGTGSGLSWTGLSSGNGYYVVSANAATCTATSTPVNVTTTANPAALVLTGSTICVSPGGNGTITSTTSVVGVDYQLYNSANATVQAAKTGTGSGLSWTGLSSGNDYYVIATIASTCTATSLTVDVANYSNPTISTSGTAVAVCYNANSQTTTLPYTATANSPVSYTIDWDDTANNAGLVDQGPTGEIFAAGGGTINSIVITGGTSAGNYAGTMTISNGNGCTNTHFIVVSVVAYPDTPEIEGESPVCGTGPTPKFYQIGDGTYTLAPNNVYTWSLTGGANILAGGGAFDDFIVLSFPAYTTYTLEVTEKTTVPVECIGPTKSKVITVNPLTGPTIFSTGSTNLCQDSPDEPYVAAALNSTSIVYSAFPAAAGTINPGTGVMDWDQAFSGIANITAISTGLCSTTTASRSVTVTPTVGAPTPITVLSEPVCQLTNGTTTTTYATTATNSTGLNWSLSNAAAGAINPTTGLMVWANGFFGAVDIRVTANGCNGPSALVSRTVNITPTVGTPTPITSSGDPTCQLTNGTTTTIYATTATNNTGFNWSLSNASAGVINPSTGVMTWANGFAGTVDIRVTANGCNGPSAMVTRTVVIAPTVGAPTPITSTGDPACQLTNGTTTTTYASTATNNTGYNWSLSNAAGALDPTTGVMTWADGFSGIVDIRVTANGCNGPSSQVTRTVIVTPTVGTPTPITISAGADPVCQLTNGTTTTTYSTTATNNTSFNWSLSNGAAGVINPTTGLMTWANGFFGTVDIQVTANGCNGPSAQVIRTVNIAPTVGTPTPITSSGDPVCQLTNGTTTTTYSTTAANNTGFNWSLSNAAAGVINPTTGVMTWANGFSGTVDIRVTANGCNGPSAQVIRTVNITQTVGTPTPITSSGDPSCQLTNGTTTTKYSTTAQNSTGFNWSISNATAGVIDPVTGVMTWANGFFGTVDIQVTANGCNGPSTQVIRTVNVIPTVGTPTPITVSSGADPVCQLTNGTTTTSYATTAADNTGFNWSLSDPLAGTISASTGIMTWANGFYGTVNIQVKANGCNGPSAQVTRTVNITPTVGTPTPILSSGDPVCQLTNGTTTTTYSTTATNSTGFNWSLSNAAAGVIDPSTGVMTWANGFSGTVVIVVTANGCNGPSVMATRTVVITPSVGNPTPITAGPEPTCQLTNGTTTTTYATTAANSTGFNWSLSNASAGVIDPSTGVMTWADGFFGTVDIRVTANGCNGPSAQVTRTVNITPTVGTPTPITSSGDPTCQLTNGTTTTIYATTATNNTGFNWSLTNPLAGSIGATTGIMTWANGFFGTVDIQVTASGCNGPSAMITRTAVITPTVGTPTPITSSGDPVCQLINGTTTTNYATTATNNTGYNWSLSNAAAGVINPTTGVMTWANGFSGTVDIRVTANGCNGPSAQIIRTVSITPTVGTPTPITSSGDPVCQLTNGTTATNYSTTPTNSTGFNWSLSNAAAGVINPTTGVMTWANGFFGTVDIQVTANGCNGPSAQVIRTVNITATVGTPTAITSSGDPACQLTNGMTTTIYTTTATNSTGFIWSLSNGAAGVINPTTGVMTWANGFAGSVDIRVTANGCNGPSAQVIRTVNITPTVGTPTPITSSGEPVCQLTNGTTTTDYATTATNNTGYNWSLSNAAAGVINPTTGVMTWADGFSGTVDIRVTANGCNGPSAQLTRTVVIIPTVGIPVFASGATSERCQGAGTIIYSASASNTTGITYSLDALTAAFPGNSINASTGAVTYAAGWSGTTTITASAAGCNGPALASHVVTITPTVTINAFIPALSTRCQGPGSVTYTTTGSNTTGITYILDLASLTGFNTINAVTGVVTYAAGWSGSTTITASAAGCNGPVTTAHVVTVTPTVSIIPYSPATSVRCQGAETVTYSTIALNSTGIIYTLDGLSQAGGNTIDGVTGAVTFAAGWSGTTTITASAAGCNGPAITSHVVTINPSTGTTNFTAGPITLCQDAPDETYTASAANSTSITYSVLPITAGTINPTTGLMNWSPVFSGSATITATSAGLCGITSADRAVTVNPSTGPTSFITGAPEVCQDAPDETYEANALNNTLIVYSVLPASAGIIDPVTGVMDWDAAFSGSATITATSTGLCGTTISNLSVRVKALPVIITSPIDTPTCEFGTINFDVEATGSDITYQWEVDQNTGTFVSIPAGGNYSGQNSSTLQIWSAVRTMNGYRYRAVVSGCLPDVTSGPALLTVNQAPEITVHPSNLPLCLGDNSTFTADATGTLIAWQWEVNRNDGFGFVSLSPDAYFSDVTEKTLIITNVQSTFNNWLFRAKATGICGVPVNTSVARLIVTNPPNVTTPLIPREICENGTTFFLGNGSGYTSLQWEVSTDGNDPWVPIGVSDPQYVGAVTNQLSIVNGTTTLSGYYYRLGLIGTCAITYTNEVTLTVHPNPVVSFAADIDACGGFPVVLNGNPSGGTLPYAQHRWTGEVGPLNSYTVQSPTFSSLMSDTYDLNYEVIDSKGCKANDNIAVIVDSPSADFTPDISNGCTPLTVTFLKTMTGISKFWWDFKDGSPIDSINANPVHTFTNTNPSSIEYRNVTLTVQSTGGCYKTYSSQITIYPEVDPTFTSSTIIVCSGDQIIFTALSGASKYYWEYGDGAGGYATNVSSHLYTNFNTIPEVHTVKLTTTSFYSCEKSYTLDVTVMPVPMPQFSAVPPTQVYNPAGNPVTFTDQTNTGTWTYLWRFGDGATSTLQNPPHTFTALGTFNVTMVVSNASCSDSIAHQVTITPIPPVADFDSIPSGCSPLYIEFNNTSLNTNTPGTSFRWDFGDGSYSTAENPTNTYFTEGSYRVELTVTGPGGTSVKSQVVNAYISPKAYFEITPSLVFVNDERVRCFNLTQFADTYLWEFGDGDTSKMKEPYHKYMEEGVYDVTLWAYSSNGCSDKFVLSPAVTVEPAGDVRFSTVFTPNKEGPIERTDLPTGGTEIDQFFFPPVREKVINYKLQIFNRLGVLIFESHNINIPWNGYYKGKLCSQGVYVWYVEGKYANGEPFKKVGDVTLLH